MLVTMLCWGSWANTVKACPGYRFQLFYWDYVIGLILGALAWGLTLGSFGASGLPLTADLQQADLTHLKYAIAGGVIFNVANLLLVAAIDIAGLAVAFPVGIGLALIVGAISSYVLAPSGNPMLLFGGVLLVTAAIGLDAMAYRLRELRKAFPQCPRPGDQSHRRPPDGQLLPVRLQGDDRRTCARPLCDHTHLLLWRGPLCAAGELSVDAASPCGRRHGRH
jgi:hypothetical protein